MCFELLKLLPRRQPSLRSLRIPFSFGKKEEGLKLQELTSCFHNGLADSRDGQAPVIIPLYCINTYWRKKLGDGSEQQLRVHRSHSSAALEVPPDIPLRVQILLGTLTAVPRIPPWTHTMDRQESKVRTRAGCVQQVWKRARSSSSAVAVSAIGQAATWPSGSPRASLLLVLWLELSPRPIRILPGPEGYLGLGQ